MRIIISMSRIKATKEIKYSLKEESRSGMESRPSKIKERPGLISMLKDHIVTKHRRNYKKAIMNRIKIRLKNTKFEAIPEMKTKNKLKKSRIKPNSSKSKAEKNSYPIRT